MLACACDGAAGGRALSLKPAPGQVRRPHLTICWRHACDGAAGDRALSLKRSLSGAGEWSLTSCWRAHVMTLQVAVRL